MLIMAISYKDTRMTRKWVMKDWSVKWIATVGAYYPPHTITHDTKIAASLNTYQPGVLIQSYILASYKA